MHTIVFVPGIMGTRLYLGEEEVWPPEVREVLTGYHRIDKLLNDAVKPGAIIDKVGGCFDFYGSILNQFEELNFTKDGAENRLVLFPYDWRRDLHETAKALSDLLETIAAGGTRITLVAHSMGGLISRLALEVQPYARAEWLAQVDRFIALAVPQRGAPLALARILGLDKSTGISEADFKKMAADVRYPSGYQLLPGPNTPCFYDEADGALDDLDIFDPAVAQRFGLSAQLLARTRAVHDGFAQGERPANVKYFQFGGTGLDTVTRVSYLGQKDGTPQFKVRKTERDGDGTVPLLSALNADLQHLTVVNEHAHVFTGIAFKRAFFRLFDRNIGILPSTDEVLVTVSAPSPTFSQGEAFNVALAFTPATSPNGQLVLTERDNDGNAVGPGVVVATIADVRTEVETLTQSVPGIAKAGIYRLEFVGDQVTEVPATFAVSRV